MVFGGPYVHVDNHGTAKVVDLHFLGEYCIGISRIQLIDRSSERVIWEITAVENNDTGICVFSLHVGSNPVRVGQPEDHDFRVRYPPQTTFDLEKGKTYELAVWGNNGLARWGVTRRHIRF